MATTNSTTTTTTSTSSTVSTSSTSTTSTTSSDTTSSSSSGSSISSSSISSSLTSSLSSTSISTTFTSLTSTPGEVTVTSSVFFTPTTSDLGPTVAAHPKTFLQNTAAVAATFTVAGLVVAALLILVVTTSIRKRRAARFDREIAEAAAEAATAPVPIFLDDEDDRYDPGYGGGYPNSPSGGGYSDVSSHGTYGQPAMSQENYNNMNNMSERPGPGLYDPSAAMYGAGAVATGAGAAGIGVVRARSTRDPAGYAAALDGGGSPYPAFATPGHFDRFNGTGMAPMHQQPRYRGGPGSGESHDGMIPYSQGTQSQYSQSVQSDLSRMKSSGSRSPTDAYYNNASTAATSTAGPETYAAHYQPGFDAASHQPYPQPRDYQPGAFRSTSPQQYGGGMKSSSPVPVAAPPPVEDAYGGYTDAPTGMASHGGIPNPFARGEDDDEGSAEESGRRVLKVAND